MWELFQTVLSAMIQALLPLVLAAVVAWLAAKVRSMRATLGEQRWQLIWNTVYLAVSAAEQSGLAGLIAKEGAAKKAYAIEAAQRMLSEHGIRLDVKVLADLVEAAVLAANWGEVVDEAD